VHAPSAQSGALQLPPLHEKVQLEPGWHAAFGQTAALPLHRKSQVEPARQVTAKPLQSPAELQLKLQLLPAAQVALPLH
jgi:hypothetical protein